MDKRHAILLQNYQNYIYTFSWTKLTRDNIFLDNFFLTLPSHNHRLCAELASLALLYFIPRVG